MSDSDDEILVAVAEIAEVVQASDFDDSVVPEERKTSSTVNPSFQETVAKAEECSAIPKEKPSAIDAVPNAENPADGVTEEIAPEPSVGYRDATGDVDSDDSTPLSSPARDLLWSCESGSDQSSRLKPRLSYGLSTAFSKLALSTPDNTPPIRQKAYVCDEEDWLATPGAEEDGKCASVESALEVGDGLVLPPASLTVMNVLEDVGSDEGKSVRGPGDGADGYGSDDEDVKAMNETVIIEREARRSANPPPAETAAAASALATMPDIEVSNSAKTFIQ
ncbi:unnamed protein product [Cyprideis torosa]|uniref:Uncharacterized protein n=1 Tax=Cyprideis torosa TaxID=163714 RepID=A0A7R8WKI4_9CRUS|nr:unnamed protein product [Cyprideis torosa]CAG0900488.1 unnamed protein product [Cyprideis torosa]